MSQEPMLPPPFDSQEEAQRTALSAPQPTSDERVAEHMRTVAEYKRISLLHQAEHGPMVSEYQRQKVSAWAAVEASARALLSASQEDAEMLDWLDGEYISMFHSRDGFTCLHSEARQILQWAPSLREAIRAAMKPHAITFAVVVAAFVAGSLAVLIFLARA